jgi:hypothetical protein
MFVALKKRICKEPLLRFNYHGFYYDNKIRQKEPEFFKWEEVKSIKIAKYEEGDVFDRLLPFLAQEANYSIRIYVSDKYIEINEYTFTGKNNGRHEAIKIFRKYLSLGEVEEEIIC